MEEGSALSIDLHLYLRHVCVQGFCFNIAALSLQHTRILKTHFTAWCPDHGDPKESSTLPAAVVYHPGLQCLKVLVKPRTELRRRLA